MCNTLAEIQAL